MSIEQAVYNSSVKYIEMKCTRAIDKIKADRVTLTSGRDNVPAAANCVVTATLSKGQDLTKPVNEFRNCKENIERFASLVIKCTKPKSSCMLFKTGIIVSVGTKTRSTALFSLYSLRKHLKQIDIHPNFVTEKVSNYVFTSHLGFCVSISKFMKKYRHLCTHDPKRFSGCTFQLPEWSKVTKKNKNANRKISLFEGGAYLILGFLSHKEGRKVDAIVRRLAAPFRTDSRDPSERPQLIEKRVQEITDSVTTFDENEIIY